MDVTVDYILKPTFECLLTVIEKGICVCVMCAVKERGNGEKKERFRMLVCGKKY